MIRRLFYAAAGAADVIGAHQHRTAGVDDPSEVSLTFSGLIEDFVERHGAQALFVSPHGDGRRIHEGAITLEHAAKRWRGGIGFHIEQVRYGLFLLRRARAFHADTALLDIGCTHAFVMLLFRLAGIRVIAVLHNTLWPAGFPPRGRMRRAILALDRLFWRFGPAAVIGVSPECLRQVEALAPGGRYPRLLAWAQFRRAYFDAVRPPPEETTPFEILFVGRAEEDKGVLDLVAIAQALEARQPGLAHFTVCGDGAALPALREAVRRAGLDTAFDIVGWTQPAALIGHYSRAHAAIVPTRSTFAEGMAMTALQAACAGRPLITSPVVPAAEVLADAAIVARTDDPSSYADAIHRLATDPALYARLRAACPRVAAPVFDRDCGLDRALERAAATR